MYTRIFQFVNGIQEVMQGFTKIERFVKFVSFIRREDPPLPLSAAKNAAGRKKWFFWGNRGCRIALPQNPERRLKRWF
jgi:hypothetical protein